MTSPFQKNIGALIYRKRLKKVTRKKEYLSFDRIKNIGIYFDLHEEQNFNLIKEFVKYLVNHNKEVVALGYYPGKELPNKYLLLQRFKFFTNRDISFWGIPNKLVVKYFIRKDNDLLIDFSTKNSFVSSYIVGLSNARLKSGFHRENSEILDFTIKDDKMKDMKYLFDQIIYYLKELKSK